MAVVIIGLTVIGFFILIVLVAPPDTASVRAESFGVGVGVTAYTLGRPPRLRRRPHRGDRQHHQEADERRPAPAQRRLLLRAGPLEHRLRPGHAAHDRHPGIGGRSTDDGSSLHQVTGLDRADGLGLLPARDRPPQPRHPAQHPQIFRRMREGELDEQELEERTRFARFHEPRLRPRDAGRSPSPGRCTRSAASSGSGSTPPPRWPSSSSPEGPPRAGSPSTRSSACPILFAAGMTLFDTIDGAFMNFAYGWAFSEPVRKIFYNLTVTGLSVSVALLIGTIELISVLADRLDLTGEPWDFVSDARPEHDRLRDRRPLHRSPGWSRYAVWRFGRIEERGPADLGRPSDRGRDGLLPVPRRSPGGRPGGSDAGSPGQRSPGHRPEAARARGALRCRGPGLRRVPRGGDGRREHADGRRLGSPDPLAARGARAGPPRPHRSRPGPVRAGRRRTIASTSPASAADG